MPTAPRIHRRKVTAKRHGQVANRQAKRALHTGSKTWRAIRRRVLLRDDFQCRACGGYGNEVDHVDGDDANHAEENLQTLCKMCHSSKTASETLNQARSNPGP